MELNHSASDVNTSEATRSASDVNTSEATRSASDVNTSEAVRFIFSNPDYLEQLLDDGLETEIECVKRVIAKLDRLDWLKLDHRSPSLTFPVKGRHSEAFINSRRSLITAKYTEEYGKHVTCEEHLVFLARLYQKYFQIDFATTRFAVSKRMKKSAGRCKYDTASTESVISIALPKVRTHFLTQTTARVCGIVVTSAVTAVQILLEHEFCHIVVWRSLDDSHKPHGDYFKSLAYAYFGHVEFGHEIGSSLPVERGQVVIDQLVKFIVSGEETEGKVVKLNKKTAIVERTPDDRYYVPYDEII